MLLQPFTGVKQRDYKIGQIPPMNCVVKEKKYPFDPRCRGWFLGAVQTESIFFTNPYKYVSGTIGLSASIKISNQVDNSYSVFGMDITVSNFIKKELATKRNDEYSIIFDANQNILYHQYYNTTIELAKWADLEYRNITDNEQKQEKINFEMNLNKTLDYLIYQSEGNDQQNTYLKFTKNKKEFFAYFLPVELMRLSHIKHRKSSILFVCRVQQDISEIIRHANIANDNRLFIINIVGIFFIILLNILVMVLFLFYQYYLILSPLSILIEFLKESARLQKISDQYLTNRQLQTSKFYSIAKKSKQVQEIENVNIQANKIPLYSCDLNSSQILSFQNESKEYFTIKKSKNATRMQPYFIPSNHKIAKIQCISEIDSLNFRFKPKNNQDSLLSEVDDEGQQNQEKFNLQNLVPFSLEIQIIKDAFLKLEQILSFTKTSTEINEGRDDKFIEVSHGIVIFKEIRNYFAVQKLYNQLGKEYFNLNEYQIAVEQFQSSLTFCLFDLSFISEELFWHSFSKGIISLNQEKLYTLSIRYYLIAYCFFQIVIQDIFSTDYVNQVIKLIQNQNYLKEAQSFIIKSLNILKKIEQQFFKMSKNTEINFVYILASQIFLLVNDQKASLNCFDKINFSIPNNAIVGSSNEYILNNSSSQQLNNFRLIQNYGQQQMKLIQVLEYFYSKNTKELIKTINSIFEESLFIYPQIFSLIFTMLKQQTFEFDQVQQQIEQEQTQLFQCWKNNFIIILQIESYHQSLDIIQKIEFLQELYEKVIKQTGFITLVISSENYFEVIQQQHAISNQKYFSNLMNMIYDKYLELKNQKYSDKLKQVYNQQADQNKILQNFLFQSIIQLCSFPSNSNNKIDQVQNILILDRLENKQISVSEYRHLKSSILLDQINKNFQIFILSQNCMYETETQLGSHHLLNFCNDGFVKDPYTYQYPFQRRVIICQLKQIIPYLQQTLITPISYKSIELNYVFQ